MMRKVILILCLLGCSVASAQLPDSVLRAAAATVKVRLGNSNGSGVHIGDGLYLSAAHVGRDEGQSGEVAFKSGERVGVRVIATDPVYDLMVMQGKPDPDLPWANLSSTNLRPGDTAYLAGYARGGLESWRGILQGSVSPVQPGAVPDWVTYSGAAIPGDSGGPVFNEAGFVCGILWGTGQGRTTASNCGRVQRFLLPWNARLAAWRQVQCPGGQCTPQPQQYSPRPQGSGGRQVIENPPGQPSQPPSSGSNLGWPNGPPPVQPQPPLTLAPVIDHQLIADAIYDRFQETPEKFKGPKGDPGADGKQGPQGNDGADGTVSQAHLSSIVAAVTQSLRDDPSMRGPAGERGLAGPAGSLDEDQIKSLTLAILDAVPKNNRRVVLVDGATGKVIDEETYGPDEPIVLDVQSILSAARQSK